MRPVLRDIHEHPDLSLEIIITGMHLMSEFGKTIDEIIMDGFNSYVIDVRYENDTKESMALFIGRFIQELTSVVKKINPDIILVLGDRGEMLAGAIVGVYLSIPVAHIHGGEITSTVDDFARHAITKLAHIHFPATEKSRDRILRMGENPTRVYVVGAPGIDQIMREPLLSKETLTEKYHLDFSKPIIIIIQHSVSLEVDDAPAQIRETFEAIVPLRIQTIVIYPNADAGGRAMIEVIKEYEKYPFIKSYLSIPHIDFLSLLKEVQVLVGNSSSAIIEAPSFGLPVVNIGTRQMGRERANNVIDTIYHRDNIRASIEKCLKDIEFREMVKNCSNPYANGETSNKIIRILSRICIDNNLLIKSELHDLPCKQKKGELFNEA